MKFLLHFILFWIWQKKFSQTYLKTNCALLHIMLFNKCANLSNAFFIHFFKKNIFLREKCKPLNHSQRINHLSEWASGPVGGWGRGGLKIEEIVFFYRFDCECDCVLSYGIVMSDLRFNYLVIREIGFHNVAFYLDSVRKSEFL